MRDLAQSAANVYVALTVAGFVFGVVYVIGVELEQRLRRTPPATFTDQSTGLTLTDLLGDSNESHTGP